MGAAETDPYAQWPIVLARVARVIGGQAALHLAREVGGLGHVRIPLKPKSSHPWARVLTGEEWALVLQHFGGERIDLPRGAYLQLQKAEILRLAEEGTMSPREIAQRCHVTVRYVRKVTSGLGLPRPVDRRQLGLFGEPSE